MLNRPSRPGAGLLPLLILVAGTACGAPDRQPSIDRTAVRDTIAAAMERYQVAARAVNPDSIAAFYTPGAVLFEPGIRPIVTRDSIRDFMGSFPGVRVAVATATPDTIEVWDDMALLWGSYFERLEFPGQPVSEQHGKFVTQWLRQPDGNWLINRFYRIPLPSAPVSPPSSP